MEALLQCPLPRLRGRVREAEAIAERAREREHLGYRPDQSPLPARARYRSTRATLSRKRERGRRSAALSDSI